jgi:hypothetical protein
MDMGENRCAHNAILHEQYRSVTSVG